MLALLLTATLAALPSPSPSPISTAYGSYPLIMDIHTDAVCTTLHQTIIPVGFIAKTNDAAFDDVRTHTLKVAMSLISDDKDFEMLARRDQRDVSAVLSNSQLALALLAQSRNRFPADKSPSVEAMRQELARVIDLQKQYNSALDAVSGAYLDSLSNRRLYGGFYGDDTADVQQRNLSAKRAFIDANRELLGLAPFDGEPISGTITEQTGATRVHKDLGDAEKRLAVTALAALRLCREQVRKPTP
ncbi:MAG TPA: hypothetical protein VIK27_11245 [Candidatus Aquilonibacter sp.]